MISRIGFLEKFKQYHFEFKHLLVLLIVLILFLILVSFVQKTSLQGLLLKTQDWYQQDSAERLANLTATSLELLLDTSRNAEYHTPEETQRIIQAFNIVLSQQKLQQNVEDVCILVKSRDRIDAIDDGRMLYAYFFDPTMEFHSANAQYAEAIAMYQEQLQEKMARNEQIYSIAEDKQIFHVFVPFVPKGELVGAVYVKNTPDFTFITREIISSYDETALIFAALIILGLLAMFYISSYTVKERDETQQLLYQEREKYLLEKIDREKEALFTKRIYHTHHKAEKVMGFIKEDLRNLTQENMDDTKYRVTRYANFVARVIYDMKWYDPPLQTIRNPVFRTDVNEVLRFIVQHIFLRTSNYVNYDFRLNLDENMPRVSINEFVVWEILEPLLQNCVEHSRDEGLIVTISTSFDPEKQQSIVKIEDNGRGFSDDLLIESEAGIKKLFLENISTKTGENSGYGCYIAHQIARKRCGWDLDAENLAVGGACFVITIPHG